MNVGVVSGCATMGMPIAIEETWLGSQGPCQKGDLRTGRCGGESKAFHPSGHQGARAVQGSCIREEGAHELEQAPMVHTAVS